MKDRKHSGTAFCIKNTFRIFRRRSRCVPQERRNWMTRRTSISSKCNRLTPSENKLSKIRWKPTECNRMRIWTYFGKSSIGRRAWICWGIRRWRTLMLAKLERSRRPSLTRSWGPRRSSKKCRTRPGSSRSNLSSSRWGSGGSVRRWVSTSWGKCESSIKIRSRRT